jgi:hypothetical protein
MFKSGYTRVGCWVDGKPMAPGAGGSVIDAPEYKPGRHYAAFIAMKDEIPYGREFFFNSWRVGGRV